ncbi:MAG: tetratricopeptide repeat protein [Gammaproteobacteria bacterium]|nr:tetratricopeptide repeat protein [Gammaproteobacteria bacterium]
MNQTSQWEPAIRRVGNDNGKERLKKGKTLMRQKHYDEALLEFSAILENNPDSFDALLGIGSVYMKQNQIQEALSYFAQARALDPLQPKPYLLEGLTLARQAQFDAAEQALRTALSLSPGLSRALAALGEVLVGKQRYEEALMPLREALRHNPQQTAPRWLMARIYAERGDLDKAIAELQTVLEIDPEHARAGGQLARWHMQRGDRAAAVNVLQQTLEHVPKEDSTRYQQLGRLALELECYALAETVFQEIVKRHPRRMTAQLDLAETLIRSAHLDRAEALLKKLSLKNRDAAVWVHKLLGDLYFQRQQFRLAAEQYRAAVLGLPEASSELRALGEAVDQAHLSDWQPQAAAFQPLLDNVMAMQRVRLREERAQRRLARQEEDLE